MKTFATALAVFVAVAHAQSTVFPRPKPTKPATPAQVTVKCSGDGLFGEDPCNTLKGDLNGSNGLCCIPASQSQQYETLCNSLVNLGFKKVADGCRNGSDDPVG
ncbi:hypothetical protein LX32DRAFT_698743 [Colletotrichum zoysiae]|uniref:Uncharacterized protein n=1 Tax=Colletotrichum zoysiae TaxID=1216348 RepID=A0AAD9H4L2_9PEZI|nr:hypothetical protein LX32DRAFT_698743 [Colletotrichum zoysiae]